MQTMWSIMINRIVHTVQVFLLGLLVFLSSCQQSSETGLEQSSDASKSTSIKPIGLDLAEANRLAQLPMDCIQNPLPYKSGLVIENAEDLKMPEEHHPAFYGCFDWHSAVHGHWSLVYLMKRFPELDNRERIIEMIDENLSAENIDKELAYFSMNKYSSSFERTYGWAWLLKLQEELYTWDDENAKKWHKNLAPLAEHISRSYTEYLPKLVYPIRVGEHSNTAFGLSFAYDYALTEGDSTLEKSIVDAALRFYSQDADCPISWEPSGYDFLSPCLQEMDIMRKVLDDEAFAKWAQTFLPSLYNGSLNLEPGKIKDRSDGKLVHLDGLNFSRAWCLYALNENTHAMTLANTHMDYSLGKIVDGDYAGQHWLASFALYAFKCQETE